MQASPRDIFRRTSRRALLETPNTPLEKFESEERRMIHLQETLINRPYGTGRVFFLFFQALRGRLPSF